MTTALIVAGWLLLAWLTIVPALRERDRVWFWLVVAVALGPFAGLLYLLARHGRRRGEGRAEQVA